MVEATPSWRDGLVLLYCPLEENMSIEALQKIIDESAAIAFFGGAGVSTESGIPDFRSQDGLYSQKWRYPPEEILSHSFFMGNTGEFYRFYREKMICLEAKPNAAHLKLAELEAAGKLTGIVTQNIDGLHQAAGSRRVFELHGSVLRNNCMDCGAFYDVHFILDSGGAGADAIPRCTKCGGVVKPDVVLYEEGLDNGVIDGAVQAIAAADTLIIGGTSLNVYPAASLIHYFRGERIVLINKSPTSADTMASLVISQGIGQVLGQVQVR